LTSLEPIERLRLEGRAQVAATAQEQKGRNEPKSDQCERAVADFEEALAGIADEHRSALDQAVNKTSNARASSGEEKHCCPFVRVEPGA